MKRTETIQFSVVIPLFNKGPHIAATLQSVFSQTLQPKEIIVVDDGSTDDGLDIVRTVSDGRVRVLTRSPAGPGGYAARNLGINEASSEWIAFLDADDVWLPDHLATLALSIGGCGKPVVCAFGRAIIVQNEKKRDYPIAEDHLAVGRSLDMNAILQAWLGKQYCPLWTGAIVAKRTALIAAGMFPAGRARRGGDKDMWLRLINQGHSVYSGASTVEFHQDTINRVSNNTAHVDLPIITSTIVEMLKHSTGREKSLLRRLSNQEIRLYSRRSASTKAGVPPKFLSRIYLPEGWFDLLLLSIFLVASHPLQWVRQWRRRG